VWLRLPRVRRRRRWPLLPLLLPLLQLLAQRELFVFVLLLVLHFAKPFDL
jgi:hypothetical protein